MNKILKNNTDYLYTKYVDSDRRIFVIRYDCDSVGKYSRVQPVHKMLAKVIEIPLTQIDLVRIINAQRIHGELKEELRTFLALCDDVDGLKTEIERERIPKPSFLEKRWKNGLL